MTRDATYLVKLTVRMGEDDDPPDPFDVADALIGALHIDCWVRGVGGYVIGNEDELVVTGIQAVPEGPLTVLDLARLMGAKPTPGTASYNGDEFERLGLPIISGCQVCGATLGAYNAYPSTTGFIRCRDDIDPFGLVSLEQFREVERRILEAVDGD